MSDTKACTKCGVVKPLTEYRYRNKLKGSRHHYCNQCHSEYRNARYKNLTGEIERHQTKEWSSDNRDRKNAHKARRRSAKLKATPEWADQDAIKVIYAEAQRLQDLLGIEFHIDHIVPLQGELVCGLHVENNLQVIPATLNLKKSNKFKV